MKLEDIPSQWSTINQAIERLEAGRVTFGDRSLTRPAADLVDEILQECADVAAWAAILGEKVKRLRVLAKALDAHCAKPTATNDEDDGA